MGGCGTISLDPKLTAHFDGTDQTTWTLSVSGMARLFPTQTPWSSRTRSSHGLLLFFPFSQQPSQWRLSQAISTPSLGFILFCFCNTGAGTWGPCILTKQVPCHWTTSPALVYLLHLMLPNIFFRVSWWVSCLLCPVCFVHCSTPSTQNHSEHRSCSS